MLTSVTSEQLMLAGNRRLHERWTGKTLTDYKPHLSRRETPRWVQAHSVGSIPPVQSLLPPLPGAGVCLVPMHMCWLQATVPFPCMLGLHISRFDNPRFYLWIRNGRAFQTLE